MVVYDLLLTEVWKEKVYSQIKDKIPASNSIKQYMAVSEREKPANSDLYTDLPRSINLQLFGSPPVPSDCLRGH